MKDLRAQLNNALKGRACLVGIGNVELGDDGFGVRLAEALAPVGQTSGLPVPGASGSVDPILSLPPAFGTGLLSQPEPAGRRSALRGCLPASGPIIEPTSPRISVVLAGTSPERWINRLGRFNHVIFLDAVDFSGAPGSVVLLNASEMWSRFPQVSTHKLSLGLLAGMVESNNHTRAWLLGVQPLSLQPGARLSKTMQTTFDLLRDLLASLIAPPTPNQPAAWQPRQPDGQRESFRP